MIEICLTLSDDQLDQLATAVAERLARSSHASDNLDAELVDARELARKAGVSRDYVLDHRHELGGKPIGNGSRPRWRFPADALNGWRTSASRATQPTPRRRRAPKQTDDLLPIRGEQ